MDRQVRVIEPPSPVVTLLEAKQHLVVDPGNTDDDILIGAFIDAATTWLDGPTGWLGRALGIQVLELQSCHWPSGVDDLPFPPLVDVISATYVDPSGDEYDLPYPWDFDNMPDVRGNPGDVRVRYRAGYGFASGNPVVWTNSVPAPIKVAIMMLVAQWYAKREPVAIGATVEGLPFSAQALLQPYRVYL